MKYLILENDSNMLERLFKVYVDCIDEKQIIFAAQYVALDVLAEAFKNNEVLLFNPTQITFGQYNALMMLMYSLMSKGVLGIREIHIFDGDPKEMEDKLHDLWRKDREYLDLVLNKVKIYVVSKYDEDEWRDEIHP